MQCLLLLVGEVTHGLTFVLTLLVTPGLPRFCPELGTGFYEGIDLRGVAHWSLSCRMGPITSWDLFSYFMEISQIQTLSESLFTLVIVSSEMSPQRLML
jgi:hypothetical protein